MKKYRQLFLLQGGCLLLSLLYMLFETQITGLMADDAFENLLVTTLPLFLAGLSIFIVWLVKKRPFDIALQAGIVLMSFFPCLLLLGLPFGTMLNNFWAGYAIAQAGGVLLSWGIAAGVRPRLEK